MHAELAHDILDKYIYLYSPAANNELLKISNTYIYKSH